jgi:hypothetical protein
VGGGFRVWSKEQGLGPCRVGVRGFESHPPHLPYLKLFSRSIHEKNTKSGSVGLKFDDRPLCNRSRVSILSSEERQSITKNIKESAYRLNLARARGPVG